LKNLKLYETNRAWTGKISIEDLKGFGYGRMRFPFTFWHVKYSKISHSRSRKLPRTQSMLLTASQETSQKAIAAVSPLAPVANFIRAMKAACKPAKSKGMNTKD